MKLFVTTYDKSSPILTQFEYLADKYIPEIDEIYVLGYKQFPSLSERFKIISIAEKQESISKWTREYHNAFDKFDEKFIFVCMDNMFPASKIDYEVLNSVMKIMEENPNIGRYELGIGHSWHGDTPVLYEANDWQLYAYGDKSEYRISCMPSIWRKEYLLKYLNNDWTPWQFEVDGSRMAKTDGYIVVATRGRYALKCNHTASTTRYPGLMNVAGLEHDVVEEMIEKGLLNRDVLILGENLQTAKQYK